MIDLEELPPIPGIYVHYYYICKRKLWLYAHGIRLEHEDENIKIGKLIHETYYPKTGRNILAGNIMIDLIQRSKDIIIIEIKKSTSQLEALINQLYYYLYTIERTGTKVKGQLRIPRERRIIRLELTPEKRKEIENTIKEITKIISQPEPPPPTKKKICRKCAYHDYCYV